MAISFDIPEEIAEQLQAARVDIPREAREAFLLGLYRDDRISHAQLRDALGLSFHETEVLLKERGMGQDIDLEEFEAGRAILRKEAKG